MSDERYEKRAAFVVAKARHRAFAERYAPAAGLGAREALGMTEEARVELNRLAETEAAAERAWRDSLRSSGSTPVEEERAS